MNAPIRIYGEHSQELRHVPRQVALAILCCLLLLLTACSIGTSGVLLRPDPPPVSLTQPCDEGPVAPTGRDATLDELAPVVKARDKAAATCRERHGKLADWALKATGKSTPVRP